MRSTGAIRCVALECDFMISVTMVLRARDAEPFPPLLSCGGGLRSPCPRPPRDLRPTSHHPLSSAAAGELLAEPPSRLPTRCGVAITRRGHADHRRLRDGSYSAIDAAAAASARRERPVQLAAPLLALYRP